MIAAAKQDMVAWRQSAIGTLQGSEIDVPIIDIHTHMRTLDWIELLRAHGAAALPYLAGRFDICHERIPACSAVIKDKPSSYLQRIYYDTVVYEQVALELCIKVASSTDHVLYGSDYPHNIGYMVGCLARVNALPDRQMRQIAGKNAERIFRI